MAALSTVSTVSVAGDTLSASGDGRTAPFAQRQAPNPKKQKKSKTKTNKQNELELNQEGRRGVGVTGGGRGGQAGDSCKGLCHVTPSGYGESWQDAGGSGSPRPGSRGHRRVRAMVRARGAAPSLAAGPAAGAVAMLGTAALRAAPPGPLHGSQAGQQQATSARADVPPPPPIARSQTRPRLGDPERRTPAVR